MQTSSLSAVKEQTTATMIATRGFPFARAKKQEKYTTGEPKTLDTLANWHTVETITSHTTEPVVIPLRNNHQIPRSEPHKQRRSSARKHSEKLSDSTRALLADTAIPTPKFSKNAGRRKSGGGQRLTVDAVLRHTTVTEKEFSTVMRRSSGYMDILLSPPDEVEEDDTMQSDAGQESIVSSRTMSSESMPSLDGASPGDASPSFRSLATTPSLRGRRSIPTRSWLSLTSVAARDALDHPLSSSELDMEEFTFKSSENASLADTSSDTSEILVLPRRGFKSNITASLRAITMAARSSARSLSSFTAPPIMPEDFLHRSIINEPNTMPFTDDRMPPKLLDVPTPELRRYLNPISNAPIQSHVPSSKIQLVDGKRTVTASMQLRTYRLNRASPSQNHSVISIRTKPTPEHLSPIVQERGYRDNSDFERRLCFDKLMRQAGKLHDTAPSKASLSCPPRKQSESVYKINTNGVPQRWIGTVSTYLSN